MWSWLSMPQLKTIGSKRVSRSPYSMLLFGINFVITFYCSWLFSNKNPPVFTCTMRKRWFFHLHNLRTRVFPFWMTSAAWPFHTWISPSLASIMCSLVFLLLEVYPACSNILDFLSQPDGAHCLIDSMSLTGESTSFGKSTHLFYSFDV